MNGVGRPPRAANQRACAAARRASSRDFPARPATASSVCFTCSTFFAGLWWISPSIANVVKNRGNLHLLRSQHRLRFGLGPGKVIAVIIQVDIRILRRIKPARSLLVSDASIQRIISRATRQLAFHKSGTHAHSSSAARHCRTASSRSAAPPSVHRRSSDGNPPPNWSYTPPRAIFSSVTVAASRAASFPVRAATSSNKSIAEG